MGLFTNKRIQPDAIQQNPAAAQVLGLLGVGDFQFSQSRGLKLAGRDARQKIRSGEGSSTNLFGSANMAKINDFISGANRNQFQDIDAAAVAENIRPSLEASQRFFSDVIDPTSRELVNTGFRTNTDAIRQGALHSFQAESVPMALERLSAFGAGLGSSGAQYEVGRLAADLEAELAGFEFAADESAAERRLAGLQITPELFDANTVRNVLGANALLDFGNTLEDSAAGGQLFNALTQLTSLAGSVNNPQPIIYGRAPSDAQQVTEVIGNSVAGFGSAAGGGMGGMMGG